MSVTVEGPLHEEQLAGLLRRRLVEEGSLLARLMLLGALVGAVSTGVLARLAMRLLAVVNDRVRGIRSDDGFFVGVVSLDGSLELAATGLLLGAFSGLLYACLSPLQVGEPWFRTLSISVGAGVVVASQVVHSDGVDFTFLEPAWLAVGMFVLIPIVHVAVLDRLGQRVRAGRSMRHPAWALVGVVPLVAMAPFVAVAAAVRVCLLVLGRALGGWSPAWLQAARVLLAVVFVLAVLDLVRDVIRIS